MSGNLKSAVSPSAIYFSMSFIIWCSNSNPFDLAPPPPRVPLPDVNLNPYLLESFFKSKSTATALWTFMPFSYVDGENPRGTVAPESFYTNPSKSYS